MSIEQWADKSNQFNSFQQPSKIEEWLDPSLTFIRFLKKIRLESDDFMDK